MNAARLFMALPLFAALLLCTTTTGPGGEGNGSETTARGVVVDSTGAPATGVPVQLLPAAYDPVASDTLPAGWHTLTNSKGEYCLTRIAAGTYDIEAGSAAAGLKSLITSIAINGQKADALVDTGRLEKTGTIFVRSNRLTSGHGDYIYLPGTSTFAMITDRDHAAGTIVLHNVPAGTFTDIIHVTAADLRSTDLLSDVLTILPGDSVASAFSGWKHTRQILLNTSVSGADVTGTVYNFPVLVRLGTAHFDFSQAQSSGQDIRFAKSDGTPLAHEIERWDRVAGCAEVWVKVDTVRGNDSTQAISMYWGNPDASDNSNGAAVFDTAAGFKGVWHLDESAGNISDATVNRLHGIRNGNQARCPGKIGYGQWLGGSGDYSEMGNVCNPGIAGFSISAWIKLSATKSYRTVISKTNGGVASPSYGLLVELDPNGKLMVFMATDSGEWGTAGTFVLASTADIVDTVAWHHIAVIIDRSGSNNCRLYVDGADVSDLPAGGDITAVGSVVNTLPLRIGAEFDGGYPWNGAIDECIFSPAVRSAAWIRLCYRNQGSEDRLVAFR